MVAPPELSTTTVERALVVTAHPDDVDFAAAGTVATWTAAGTQVTYLICTDGQAGGFDEGLDRRLLPALRRHEQQAAAAFVGVSDVRFLGYLDGELAPTLPLVRDIVAVLRDVRPQRVLLQNPDRWWDRLPASHPDHMASGEAAIQAVYPAARNPFSFPELLERGLAAWTVPEVWVMSTPDPNTVVDVTHVIDAKIAAILAHASQHPDPQRTQEMVRGWLTSNASFGGLPDGRLAEAFRVHHTA